MAQELVERNATVSIDAILPQAREIGAHATIEAEKVLEELTSMSIDCQEVRNYADTIFKANRAAIKALNETRLGITRPMDLAKQNVMAVFAPALTMRESIDSTLEAKIMAYDREQARIQREREAAARKAADELRRIEETKAAEEAKRQRDAAAALKAEADIAAKNGNTDHAAQLQQEAAQAETVAQIVETTPVHVPVPVVAPIAPKAKGQSGIRKKWKARVVDPNAVPREYMTVNQALLDTLAVQTSGEAKVAGVEFYEDETLVKGRG